MGLANATIREKRRIRRRYAIAITMWSSLENRQLCITSSFSDELSRVSMQSITPDGCESEEDDMYLFDIPLRRPPTLDPSHELAIIEDDITTFALKIFLGFQLGGDSQNRGRSWSRMSRQFEDMEQDDPAALIAESHIHTKRRFPCPFYISNPKKHLMCFMRFSLIEIKDVKQHLWFAHRLQPYCPTCGEIFTTTKSSDTHIRRRSCSSRELPQPEGISLQQMQQLARRADVRMSEDLQWSSLWKIVFPGAALPDFTHPSRTVEFIVCQFRDYWSSNGERAISDFLEEKGFRDYKPRDERSLVALHATVLDRVIDRLVESFEHDDDNTISTKTQQILASLRNS
ncbi:hypothetical protein F4781DRAFT_379142 [Annulohypoxylon bovei var. microspora]|nr:hypothetical protein F4781DRAFT_379142 [Annulohypoxylon bovei var. microspora]